DPEGISVIGACGQAKKALAVGGAYTIRVYDNGDGDTGTYDVNLVVVSQTASSCAQPILCGETLARNIATVGESDTYRFVAVEGESGTYRVSGAAGDVVKIETKTVGGMLNACWEFYDPTGASLGGACGVDSRTLATDLAGYTLRVHDNGETQTGDYQVTLCNPTTTTTTTTVPGPTSTTTLPGGGEQTLSGAMLLLKDGAPPKRRLVISSRDGSFTSAGPGTADDPTLFGGSLRVRSSAGGFDST